MMWRWLLFVVCACASKEPNVPPDIRVAERDVGHRLDGVIIAASGVYIGRERVPDVPAALEKLPNPVDVWLLADREPTWKTTLALRTIAAKRGIRLRRALPGNEHVCNGGRFHVTSTPPPPDEVVISLLVVPDRFWIGISRINEFQDIPVTQTGPDYERLTGALKEQKASILFENRTDIEVGAEQGVAGDVLVETIDVACRAGFTDVAILRPDLLTAVPTL